MSHLSVFLFVMTVSNAAFAKAVYTIKGKVAKIENGRAFIQTETGDKQIVLKRISKKDQQTLNEAVATKKEVSLSIQPEVLKD